MFDKEKKMKIEFSNTNFKGLTLAEIRAEAYQEGYADGIGDGYYRGYDKGFEEGASELLRKIEEDGAYE